MADAASVPATIRDFHPEDQAACAALYEGGLIGGKIADNDTGLDILDIQMTYMKPPGNHFWVAESFAGEVVGMIGVQHYDEGVGEIRRLRVHQDHRRRGIGYALVESALRFCQEQNYLKVTLDTFMERDPAIRLFEKFHFRLSTTRELSGKELVYFYLDLYAGEERPRHQPET
jgi:ribosomal protein S18 acetylase RimI-like enzyme